MAKNSATEAFTAIKLDGVTVRPWKPGKIMLDFVIPNGGRWQPILKAANRSEAEQFGRQIETVLKAQKAGIAVEDLQVVVARLQGKQSVPSASILTIPAAIETAIEKGSQARPEWKRELRSSTDQFTGWLKVAYPELQNEWGSLNYGIIQDYVGTLAGLSCDRATHRLAPIRLAAMYWQRQKPDMYRDFTGGIRMPEGKPRRGITVLTASQLKTFLDAVKRLQPALYPVAALSAFAGLRVYEAAHLRLCDVDLTLGTVVVTATETHIPKTQKSWRTLPLSRPALEVLQSLLRTLQPVDAAQPLFLSPKGCTWVKKLLDDGWKRFVKALAKENAGKTESERFTLPAGYTMRGGRRTFTTLARKAGADRFLLKCYLGQATGDILGAHYDSVDYGDLATVAKAFEKGYFVNDVLTIVESNAQVQQAQ
jgi:integrase